MKKIAKAIATIMLMTATVCTVGCKKVDDSNNGSGNGGHYDHEYVDLGLPSGTLWATCNVGANTSEEIGDYFAWGETTTKTIYNWATYTHCKGSRKKLTRYCNEPNYGYNEFTDNIKVLLSSDDAATVNWGVNWQTPTSKQWKELIDNTTAVIWFTPSGVNGWLFTASNGQNLFLPATGYHWGDDLEEVVNGYYWSSSLYTLHPSAAWYFFFNSSDFKMKYDRARGNGFPIRPVVRPTSQD